MSVKTVLSLKLSWVAHRVEFVRDVMVGNILLLKESVEMLLAKPNLRIIVAI